MGKKLDLTGQVFGRLTVISEDPIRILSGYVRWSCICECGKSTVAFSRNLVSGNTESCGCLRIETATTHGMYSTTEYNIWKAMIKRCTNSNDSAYDNYGGRGITVCDEWLDSFENFYRDMGPRPNPDHSIERKENDKGYYKDNCKWATRIEQCNNRRNNIYYQYQNEQLTLSEISRRTSISRATLEDRINRMNLSIEEAVTRESGRVNRDSITFNGMTKSLREWSEYLNVQYITLYNRLYIYSWSIEKAFSEV
jgi:hypothetical protein